MPPPHGGVATIHQRLTELAVESGFRTESWSTGGGRRVFVRRLRRFFVYLRIALRCVVGPRKIVHFLSSSRANFFVNSMLGGLAKYCGHKVILSVLGGGFEEMVDNGRSFTRWAVRNVSAFDAIVASNDDIALRLEALGMSRDRVFRIGNVFPNPCPDGDSGWPKLPAVFQNAEPRILATAAFSREYGLEVLLVGFAGLLDIHPSARLAVLLAEKDDPAYEHEIRELASDLGIGEKVFYVRGIPEVISLYRNVDLVVRATRVDGDAVSVWEALLEGKTVVASDTGQRPNDCILFPVGDSDALLTAMNRALSGDHQNGVEAVQQQAIFNLKQLLNLYSSLGAARDS